MKNTALHTEQSLPKRPLPPPGLGDNDLDNSDSV